ncbi:hypothetical protein X546_24960 [Brevibacillus borstelensis cifa_chp40]|nr:hypothetical protein X546_24960 [Brevibacillus borstelensis cifa_chp40]
MREMLRFLFKTLEDIMTGLLVALVIFMFAIMEAGGNPIALPVLIWRAIKSWILGVPMDWSPVEFY